MVQFPMHRYCYLLSSPYPPPLQWITKNESVAAKTLRKEIGLDEHLEEWQYIDKVTKQMNKNFSAIFNK